jgi:hypothetical protein
MVSLRAPYFVTRRSIALIRNINLLMEIADVLLMNVWLPEYRMRGLPWQVQTLQKVTDVLSKIAEQEQQKAPIK